MITLCEGLKNSLIVLEHLRNDEELNEIDIRVQSFHNCREMGLTFTVHNKSESTTWCIYEHRNSDEIIINGVKNWTSFNTDLPYIGDSKYDSLASFSYNEHFKAYKKLKELILKFKQEGKK